MATPTLSGSLGLIGICLVGAGGLGCSLGY
jgi:hypothetical protein